MKLVIPKSLYPFIGVLILLILVELLTPTPIDWTPNFNSHDKRPYGSFLMMDLVETEFFPGQDLEIRTLPVFNYPDNEDSLSLKNYIYITNHLEMKKWDVSRLINLVEKGNQIFIAASSISKDLQDTLNLKIDNNITFENLSQKTKEQHLTNPNITNNKTYKYEKAFDSNSIIKFNKDSLTVLGTDENNMVQLIQKKIGKGNITISCQPLAFTNYNILSDNNAEYVTGVFNYLPNLPIVWDEYYKPITLFRSSSPLSYLMTKPPLRLAYYLLLFCLLFLLIFQGKRQQQIIPEIKPLRNSSLDFIQTLGRLYYTRKNHKDIAEKKFKYFKEFIRSKYHTNFKEANFNELSKRSGIALKTLKILFNQAKLIEKQDTLLQEDLEDFHSKIEYIYNNCK